MENPTHLLSLVERERINLRAKRIYERVARDLPWERASSSIRSEFEDAAELELWQEGSLLGGPPESAIEPDHCHQSWGDHP